MLKSRPACLLVTNNASVFFLVRMFRLINYLQRKPFNLSPSSFTWTFLTAYFTAAISKIWPVYTCNATRDFISAIRNKNTRNSMNNYFTFVHTKMLNRKCVASLTIQHTFHTKIYAQVPSPTNVTTNLWV